MRESIICRKKLMKYQILYQPKILIPIILLCCSSSMTCLGYFLCIGIFITMKISSDLLTVGLVGFIVQRRHHRQQTRVRLLSKFMVALNGDIFKRDCRVKSVSGGNLLLTEVPQSEYCLPPLVSNTHLCNIHFLPFHLLNECYTVFVSLNVEAARIKFVNLISMLKK
ncbi:hypothetical protein Q3G72_034637 [Acer saccharum]|nr:hypothetical protein Q3G72_034637 [Acer saccharum]